MDESNETTASPSMYLFQLSLRDRTFIPYRPEKIGTIVPRVADEGDTAVQQETPWMEESVNDKSRRARLVVDNSHSH